MNGTAQLLETVAIPVAQPRSNERLFIETDKATSCAEHSPARSVAAMSNRMLAEPPSMNGPAFLGLGIAVRVDVRDFACLAVTTSTGLHVAAYNFSFLTCCVKCLPPKRLYDV